MFIVATKMDDSKLLSRVPLFRIFLRDYMGIHADRCNGKTALMTGETQGIGAGVRQRFARLRAPVVAGGIPPTNAQRGALGPSIHAIRHDASVAARVERAGSIDTLIIAWK